MTAPDPVKRIDYAPLKSGGIIMQKDDDFFAVRLRLPGDAFLPTSFRELPPWQRNTGGA